MKKTMMEKQTMIRNIFIMSIFIIMCLGLVQTVTAQENPQEYVVLQARPLLPALPIIDRPIFPILNWPLFTRQVVAVKVEPAMAVEETFVVKPLIIRRYRLVPTYQLVK
jgi:hypothetical protein